MNIIIAHILIIYKEISDFITYFLSLSRISSLFIIFLLIFSINTSFLIGLINTSLTRMDIRYARTIKGLQNIAAEGLKDLCLKYLEFTRPESVLRELPDFKIV